MIKEKIEPGSRIEGISVELERAKRELSKQEAWVHILETTLVNAILEQSIGTAERQD